MLNIRLDEELLRKLELLRKKKEISEHQLVEDALNLYVQKEFIKLSVYELGEDLFDSVEKRVENSASNYKTSIKIKLKEKFG